MTDHGLSETRPAGVSVDGLAARALDALPDPAFVMDLEGHVVLRNLAHKRMLAQMGIVPARAELVVDEVAARLTDPDLFRAFVAANAQEPEAEHEGEFTFRSGDRSIAIRTRRTAASWGVFGCYATSQWSADVGKKRWPRLGRR